MSTQKHLENELESERAARLALQERINELKLEQTQAVVESQKLYRSVIDTALDAVVGMDSYGLITDWNQQAENIFGWSRDEAIGRPMHDLIIPHKFRDAHKAGMANYFKTGEGPVLNTRIEIEARRRDDTIFPIELAITPIIVEENTLFSAFIRDITSRKAAEEAMEKARQEAVAANKAKSQFLANMSHEIRTPLNAVIGLSTLLIDSDLNDEQRDYLNTIRTSGDNLLGIINDILDFSKIEAGHMVLEKETFDLRRAIEDCLDVVAADAGRKKIDLAYRMGENTPPFIIGDVTRLRQIMLNLLANAVKFTEAGEVVISVQTKGVEPLENGNDLRLEFNVRDTGIGIRKDKQDRLFKAFSQVDASTTRKYGGTGLGLAIIKRLCEMMGGTVTVDSVIGEGSIFSFSVIMQEAKVSADERIRYAHLAQQQPQLEGLRVLIVDDNATNRHILEKQLTVWGMEVDSAESGFEALGMLMMQASFDVAILDMFMPRMDGAQLSAAINKAHPALPQIILSSSGKSELSNVNLDVFAYLNKPLKPTQLYNTLLSVFAHQSVRPTTSTRPTIDHTLGTSHPLRILVAEDNEVNRHVISRLLERMGYGADMAQNGREVLAALDIQSYDLILMDVQMPEMDGVEATQQIIERFPKRPRIVAVTANAVKGDRETYLAAGMDDYISKPIQIDALQAILRGTKRQPEETPPIDHAFLEEKYGDLAQEMFDDLLELFQGEAQEYMAKLQTVYKLQDAKAVCEVAHALKGASFGVGAVTLANLSQTIETAAKNNDLSKLDEQVDGVVVEVGRIMRLSK